MSYLQRCVAARSERLAALDTVRRDLRIVDGGAESALCPASRIAVAAEDYGRRLTGRSCRPGCC